MTTLWICWCLVDPVLTSGSRLRPGQPFAVEGLDVRGVRAIYVDGRVVPVERRTETQLVATAPMDLGVVATIRVQEDGTPLRVPVETGGADDWTATWGEGVVIVEARGRVDAIALTGSFSDGSLWKSAESTPGFPAVFALTEGTKVWIAPEGSAPQALERDEESPFRVTPIGGFVDLGSDVSAVFGIRVGYDLSDRWSLVVEFTGFAVDVPETRTEEVLTFDELSPTAVVETTGFRRETGLLLLAGPRFELARLDAWEFYGVVLAGVAWIREPSAAGSASVGVNVRIGPSVALGAEGGIVTTRWETGARVLLSLEIRF